MRLSKQCAHFLAGRAAVPALACFLCAGESESPVGPPPARLSRPLAMAYSRFLLRAAASWAACKATGGNKLVMGQAVQSEQQLQMIKFLQCISLSSYGRSGKTLTTAIDGGYF